MSDGRRLTPVREEDYELIEQAVMETARGRWFLSEYARRNRAADTRILLDAIKRLERVVSAQTVEFVPSLESSNAVHKVRALMRDALSDISAILAGSGKESDRIEAGRDPIRAIETRLHKQSTDMDELIASLRGAHDALAADKEASGPRSRLAQAIARLGDISKNHHGVSQAVRRGITFMRTLEQALAGDHGAAAPSSGEPESKSRDLPTSSEGRSEGTSKTPTKASSAPTGGHAADEGRIVIVRAPRTGLASLPGFSHEDQSGRPAADESQSA